MAANNGAEWDWRRWGSGWDWWESSSNVHSHQGSRVEAAVADNTAVAEPSAVAELCGKTPVIQAPDTDLNEHERRVYAEKEAADHHQEHAAPVEPTRPGGDDDESQTTAVAESNTAAVANNTAVAEWPSVVAARSRSMPRLLSRGSLLLMMTRRSHNAVPRLPRHPTAACIGASQCASNRAN